ncbi:hypothetical protein [Anoxybacillus sp. TBDG-1]
MLGSMLLTSLLAGLSMWI